MYAKKIKKRVGGGVGVGWGWVGGGTHHSFDITSAVDNVGSKDLYDGKTNGIC